MSKIRITAFSGVEDLLVLAMRLPELEVEMAMISEGWAYSFSSSGERV